MLNPFIRAAALGLLAVVGSAHSLVAEPLMTTLQTTVVTVENTNQASMDRVLLTMPPNVNLVGVKSDEGVSLAFEQWENQVQIKLALPLLKYETRELTLEYGATLIASSDNGL